MAPLSKKLVELCLEHDHFGSHLDENGKTFNLELEPRNFKRVGDLLGKIWSEGVFDGYYCKAKHVDPKTNQDKLAAFDEYDQKIADKHVVH